MATFKVRQKFATIREAEVEADSADEAFRIASTKDIELFPENAKTYVETEFDSFDEEGVQHVRVPSDAEIHFTA
jgi:hypothetical protein